MLSKSAIMMLKWFDRCEDWMYKGQIENKYAKYEYSNFSALEKNGYLAKSVDEGDVPEVDPDGTVHLPEQFQISDAGRAFLEMRKAEKIDKWITRAISVAALIISIIALILR